jgi:integrase
MANIEKRQRDGRTSYRVRYRTPAGAQRNKTFARRADAERFRSTVESAKHAGTYIDPARGRVAVGEWAEKWLAGQAHLKPSSYARSAGIVRTYIVPTWGKVRLAQVSHADVQAWVSTLSAARSPATVRKVHRTLSLILDLAVRDGRLGRNVAEKINLPRPVRKEQRHLTITQVENLARECGYPSDASKHRSYPERAHEPYRLAVLFLAYTGVRFGEMAALRAGRVDLERRRAVIAESVTVVQGKGLVWGTPKTHQRREVPLPRFLVDQLAPHLASLAPDDLVFTGVRRGTPLRAAIFRRGHFEAAATAIGIPGLHPHELRHTAASLAIAAGADVKVVQQMLGHASATMTMDTYGHLFENRLDEVADALDRARAQSEVDEDMWITTAEEGRILCPGVSPACPEGEVTDLTDYRSKRVSAGQARSEMGAPGRIRTYASASGGRHSIP